MNLNTCCVCSEYFAITQPNKQAVCLPCGHTACRSCLSHMRSPHCPICHAPFACNPAVMAPNHIMHQMLAAAAPGDSLVSLKSNVRCIITCLKELTPLQTQLRGHVTGFVVLWLFDVSWRCLLVHWQNSVISSACMNELKFIQ